MSNNSNPPSVFLARLAGPTILALAVTEPLNAHIFPGSTAATVYLNGTVLFAAGLSIVVAHNVWCRRWPVLVTALGWFVLALGSSRMLWPEAVLAQVRDRNPAAEPVTAALMSTVGGILCWKGYFS